MQYNTDDGVRKENAFSGLGKETVGDFISDLDQFKKENELISALKKKPMFESEVREFVARGKSDLEKADILAKYGNLLQKLRDDELIVPDPKLSLGEFKKLYPDKTIIKASLLQQLSTPEYDALANHGFKVFQDMPDGDRVIHWQYQDNAGGPAYTGTGILVIIKHIDEADVTVLKRAKFIAEAENRYKKARAEITELFKSIGLTTKEEQKYGTKHSSDYVF